MLPQKQFTVSRHRGEGGISRPWLSAGERLAQPHDYTHKDGGLFVSIVHCSGHTKGVSVCLNRHTTDITTR